MVAEEADVRLVRRRGARGDWTGARRSLSRRGMRLASEKHVTNVSFTQADGTALPIQDGAFDLFLSHSVIEHFAIRSRI